MVGRDVHIDCCFTYYVCSGDGCYETQFPVGSLKEHITARHSHRHISLSINEDPIPEDIVEQLGVAFDTLGRIPTPLGSCPILEFEYYLGSCYIHCRRSECESNPRIPLVEIASHVANMHPFPAANVVVRTRKGFLISNELKRDIADLGRYYTGGQESISRAAPVAVPQPGYELVNPPPKRSGSLSYLLNPAEPQAAPANPPDEPKREPSAESKADLETASILLQFAHK